MTDLDNRLPVILLTRPGCSLCDRAHDLLNRLASDYPLVITTLDAEEPDGAALAVRTGILYTPGIVIGDDAVVSGHVTERRLRRAIERRLPSRTGSSPPHATWRQRGRSVLGWLSRRA